MRKWLSLILLVASVAYAAPKVTSELAAHLEEVSPDELVRILIVMEARMPQEELLELTDGLPRDQRRVVVEALVIVERVRCVVEVDGCVE